MSGPSELIARLRSFVFNSALNNVDTINDFQANAGDSIVLDNEIFSALGVTGTLAGTNFAANAGGNASDANDYILWPRQRWLGKSPPPSIIQTIIDPTEGSPTKLSDRHLVESLFDIGEGKCITTGR